MGGEKTRQALALLDTNGERIRQLYEGEGLSIRQVVAKLAEEGIATSRTYVHSWLGREDNREWYKPTVKARAAELAEQSLEVLNTATRDTIPVDREKARGMQWMAERMDPEQWGAKGAQVNVQVNVADAFIQAMREG